MANDYIDRGKQRLEQGSGTRKYELSAPLPGYVALPRSGEYFGCTVVLADGKWWAGKAEVVEDSDGGGSFWKLLFSPDQYANWNGSYYNLLDSEDFSTNPADVFCTLTASVLNEILEKLDGLPAIESQTGQNSFEVDGGTSFPVSDTFVPGFSTIYAYSCPNCTGEFEISVAVSLDGTIVNVYAGSLYLDGSGGAASTFAKVQGSDTNVVVAVETPTGSDPVLPNIECQVTGGVGTYLFMVRVTAKNVVCVACW